MQFFLCDRVFFCGKFIFFSVNLNRRIHVRKLNVNNKCVILNALIQRISQRLRLRIGRGLIKNNLISLD